MQLYIISLTHATLLNTFTLLLHQIVNLKVVILTVRMSNSEQSQTEKKKRQNNALYTGWAKTV